MNIKIIIFTISLLIITSCKKEKTIESVKVNSTKEIETNFKNQGHELVYDLVQKVGTYEQLRSKHDVIYTYTYTIPNGKSDVSTEKYIFDNELSYGEYRTHERSYPELEGTVEQGYDGNEYWLKHNGEIISNSMALKRAEFVRSTNFYWFAMFQKLLDPGLNYEYLGEQILSSKQFDVVKISFESDEDIPTDIYQLYINKETGLIDQFLFTVVDYGVMEEPLLMQVEYESVEGLLLPSKRRYKKSTWDAEINNEPWITAVWTDIHFDNSLTRSDFKK